MNLGELLKKIYQPKDDVEERKIAGDVYDTTKFDEKPDGEKEKEIEREIFEEQGTEETPEKIRKVRNKRTLVVGATTIAILVGIVVLIFLYFKFIGSAFTEEKVMIEVVGSDEVKSAVVENYLVKIENKNRVTLRGANLRLEYPEELVLQEEEGIMVHSSNIAQIEVGEIGAGEKYEVEVSFAPYGPRNRQAYINAIMRYQPTNFSSDFERSYQKSILITSSPISITLVPVKQAASGEVVEIDVILKNEGKADFKNLLLKMEYPEGFVFTGSSSEPSEDNRIWKVTKLASKQQHKLTIRGTLEGAPGLSKKFNVRVGKDINDKFSIYTESEGFVKLIQNRVELTHEISNINEVYAGSEVRYKLKFKNSSDVPLRNLVLEEYIESEVINKEKLVILGKGYYDNIKNKIVWRAVDVPELALLEPGAEGEVEFIVEVKERFDIENDDDKNFTINSHAEIESLDIDSPIWNNKKVRSAESVIKVNSKLILEVDFSYNDGELPNEGPVPLEYNKETTFTGRARIMNTSNDLKDVVLSVDLPTGIKWKNKYIPEGEKVEYNDRTGKLEWHIGSIDAGVGFSSPVKTFAFQLGVVPSVNQVSNKIVLMSATQVDAVDTFTGNKVQYEFKDIRLPDVKDVNVSKILN